MGLSLANAFGANAFVGNAFVVVGGGAFVVNAAIMHLALWDSENQLMVIYCEQHGLVSMTDFYSFSFFFGMVSNQ